MIVLGVHDGHNASAAILVDGKVVSGVQEERLSGVKDEMRTPYLAMGRLSGRPEARYARHQSTTCSGNSGAHSAWRTCGSMAFRQTRSEWSNITLRMQLPLFRLPLGGTDAGLTVYALITFLLGMVPNEHEYLNARRAPARIHSQVQKLMESPYMILAFPGTERIEDFRAGAHPHDLTVRPQPVNCDWNPDYHRLISLFAEPKGQGCHLEHLAQPPRVPNG